MTVTYCTAQEVCNYLRLIDPSTGARINIASPPAAFDMTQAEIEALINSNEDQIDTDTQHAWRIKTVTNEFQSYRDPTLFGAYTRDFAVFLDHYDVQQFTRASGDKLEIWKDTKWVDCLDPTNGFSEGMGIGDGFWVDYVIGAIHFNTAFPSAGKNTVRVTYRYGESAVHSNVKKACILLTAIDMLGNDRYRVIATEAETLSKGFSTSAMQDKVEQLLAQFKTVRV